MEDLSAGQAGSATCRSSKTLVTSRSEHRSGPLSVSSRSFSPPTAPPPVLFLGFTDAHLHGPSHTQGSIQSSPPCLPVCSSSAPAPRGLPSPPMVTHPGIRSPPAPRTLWGASLTALGRAIQAPSLHSPPDFTGSPESRNTLEFPVDHNRRAPAELSVPPALLRSVQREDRRQAQSHTAGK